MIREPETAAPTHDIGRYRLKEGGTGAVVRCCKDSAALDRVCDC
jgi:hypothetical protein